MDQNPSADAEQRVTEVQKLHEKAGLGLRNQIRHMWFKPTSIDDSGGFSLEIWHAFIYEKSVFPPKGKRN